MELGYVGLGAMGGALARRLMLTHKLRVFDLRPDLVSEFAGNGAIPAQDGASLARECDLVMLCLPRSADVRAAIFAVAPDVEEGLRYGMLDYPGLANLGAQKHYVALYVAPEVLARHVDAFPGVDRGKEIK